MHSVKCLLIRNLEKCGDGPRGWKILDEKQNRLEGQSPASAFAKTGILRNNAVSSSVMTSTIGMAVTNQAPSACPATLPDAQISFSGEPCARA